MTGPQPSPSAWWRAPVFVAAAATLTFLAALAMLSAFMFYDDEGYVLTSLRNYAGHGALYRDVYTQYGPFPYVLYHLLHLAGLPFTHVAGRLVTLAAWAGAALGCAAIAWRATRSFVTTLAVLAGAYVYLWIMISEPTHPGGLIALLVAVAAAVGSRWLEAGRTDAWAALAGAIAGALVLTKINVGGFVVLAALAWIALHHRSDGLRRWAPVLVAAGGFLVPLALMRPMLGLGWVQSYALTFACTAVAAAVVTGRTAAPLASARTLGCAIAGGLAVAAVVIGAVLVRGTALSDLVAGVLLNPLRQPAAFNLRYVWPTGSAALAVASLGLCLAAVLLSRREAGARLVAAVVAGLRLLAALGLVYALLRFPAASPDRLVFGYGAPCLWLFLWPLADRPAARAATAWVGWLWLGQFLHAFPVAGSQIAWGTFLALPLAAAGAHEAAGWLAARSGWPAAAARTAAVTGRCLLAALALGLGWRFRTLGLRYLEGSDLGLPGAEILRLPSESSALFRLLTANAQTHGDLLFSEPGMLSLNLWSGLPTPTLANTTHWFSLLDRPRQEAIVRVLEAHPRACIIRQRDHLDFLTRRSFAPAGVLHDYVTANFEVAFRLDDFEFCVRRGRRIEPVQLGTFGIRSELRGTLNTELRLRLRLPTAITVGRIELTSPNVPDAAPLVLAAGSADVEVTPLDATGQAAGTARSAKWPLQLSGLVELAVSFDRFAQPRPFAGGLITFRSPDGAEVALARLRE